MPVATQHVKGPSQRSPGSTDLQYLSDSYMFEASSAVIACDPEGDEAVVVLDATIMYPQGGGQPSDVGRITGPSGVLKVTSVAMEKGTGVVLHKGKLESGSFNSGDIVQVVVDEQVRRFNARNHSAGHLLDVAMENIGFTLVPTKGYHFPKGAYVEYEGTIPDAAAVVALLQDECARLIATEQNVKNELVGRHQVAAKCNGFDPPYIPQSQQEVRIITVAGNHGSPCGGTHVQNLKDIGGINITKVKAKKNKGVKSVRVSYAITS